MAPSNIEVAYADLLMLCSRSNLLLTAFFTLTEAAYTMQMLSSQ